MDAARSREHGDFGLGRCIEKRGIERLGGTISVQSAPGAGAEFRIRLPCTTPAAAFEILERLRRGEWRLVLSNHVLLEYEEVLKRNAGALALSHEEVDRYLNAICQAADCFQLPAVQPPRPPDSDDEPLLWLAETSGARLITTHNLRHLRPEKDHGVTVLLPREFLRNLCTPP